METGADGPLTPRTAAEARQQLARDEAAVRYPPLPTWFFAAMAVLVAALFLVQLLPSDDAGQARIAVAVVAVVLGSRYWLNRPGVAWVAPHLPDMAWFLVAVLGSYAACWVVWGTIGLDAVWVAGAALAAGVVLVTGRRYRREFGDVG
ncbi:hypothetical protein GB931_01765 [Modestobacter sp. I12A-02628]|uniref:Uncharacterized protein n=1 Tax=Goekera deserti TaxID=2497753 RepID=A0A7K3WKN8_9ACTN|nr:hypothetical protein [Goekera deserti]MPQ96665.1 hypothetical protein [Goekera deserti]NDI47024.1 hypothetical protein [Goekera deserti]NEL56260.1 hypothetical protein [Goekera deserti]